MRFKFITHAAGLLLALWASPMLAQSNYQQVVESTESGSKVFLKVNLMHLQQSMDSIFLQLTELSTTSDTLAYLLGVIAQLQEGGSGGGSDAFTCGTSTVTFDGHDYSTVEIGDQCWFAENLRSTQYADGSTILEVTDGTTWAATSDGARAAYGNDANNLSTYGYLYNWHAVNNAAGLCPTDWHVPTDDEWTTLTTHLGGESGAGEFMKSSDDWNGTNTSGFSALPGGYRSSSGSSYVVGNVGLPFRPSAAVTRA